MALLEKRRFLYNHSGDFPQVILIVPSHVPNSYFPHFLRKRKFFNAIFFNFLHLFISFSCHFGKTIFKCSFSLETNALFRAFRFLSPSLLPNSILIRICMRAYSVGSRAFMLLKDSTVSIEPLGSRRCFQGQLIEA